MQTSSWYFKYLIKISKVGAELRMSSTIFPVPVPRPNTVPLVLVKSFHVTSMSWIKITKITGPLTGPKGMTLKVYFVFFGAREG